MSLIQQDSAALAASLAPIELPAGTASVPPDLAADVARTEAIVAAIDELLANERRLLDERLAVIGSHNTVAFATVVLGAIGSVALIGIIFAMMHRDLAAASGWRRHIPTRCRRANSVSAAYSRKARSASCWPSSDGQRIVQANPAFCRMLGADADQIIGRTIAELAHVDDRELLSDAIRRGTDPDLASRRATSRARGRSPGPASA